MPLALLPKGGGAVQSRSGSCPAGAGALACTLWPRLGAALASRQGLSLCVPVTYGFELLYSPQYPLLCPFVKCPLEPFSHFVLVCLFIDLLEFFTYC